MATRVFYVNSPKTKELFGILVLEINEVEKLEYCNLHELTISSHFYHGEFHPKSSNFYASYRDDLIGKIASISSNLPGGKGDIIFNYHPMHGYRMGSLIMHLKVEWLKKLPNDFPVKGIHFSPAGDKNLAERFYRNFGVPIDGSEFTVGRLISHESWKENIVEIKSSELDRVISNHFCKINTLKSEISYLSELNQLSSNYKRSINILNFWICRDFRPRKITPVLYETDSRAYPLDQDLGVKIKLLQQSISNLKNLESSLTGEKERNINDNRFWSIKHTYTRFTRAINRIWNKLAPLLVLAVLLVVLYLDLR